MAFHHERANKIEGRLNFLFIPMRCTNHLNHSSSTNAVDFHLNVVQKGTKNHARANIKLLFTRSTEQMCMRVCGTASHTVRTSRQIPFFSSLLFSRVSEIFHQAFRMEHMPKINGHVCVVAFNVMRRNRIVFH